MSRRVLIRFRAPKVIHPSVRISTFLLLIGSPIFGQSYQGLSSPGRSDFPGSGSIEIKVSKQLPQGDAGTNIVTLQELQHVVPRKARKEMEKAEAARSKNHIDDAISHYCQAISLDPEFVAARNNLAIVYFAMAQEEAAITQLEAAVKADPHNPALFTNLALGYVVIHQYEAAERAARVVASLGRTEALPQLVLGLAFVAQRKSTAEALQYFEQAGGTYAEAHLFAAKLLMTEGQFQRAKSEIQIYLATDESKSNRELANRWFSLIENGERKTVASTN